MNLNSNQISVYPSVRRSDIFDRNARLYTEKNIVDIVNRLTNNSSFVIGDLIIENNTTLKAFRCNLGGYLINIKEDITLSDIKEEELTDGGVLYISANTNDEEESEFIELAINDTDDTASSTLNGIDLDITSDFDDITAKFKLKLATYINGTWVINNLNQVKYNSKGIAVQPTKTGLGSAINTTTTLSSFIDSLIIDDGDLDDSQT